MRLQEVCCSRDGLVKRNARGKGGQRISGLAAFWGMLLLALPSLHPVHAQEVARIPIVDAPPGTPGLGAGIRNNTVPYLGEEQGYDLVPLYLFEGKYLFAHGTSGGVHLLRDERFSLDLVASYRFQRLDPGDNPLLAGLESRDQTVDGGLAFGYRGDWGRLQARWTADMLGRHNGQELELGYRYSLDTGRWTITPWASATWHDDDLTDYYFGVSQGEVAPGRPEYHPGDAWTLGLGINTSYQLTRNLLAFMNLGFYSQDDVISSSPLVDEERSSVAYFGAAYMFGNVFEPQDSSPERAGEWSWRLNYGYQAEGSIATDNLRGDLSAAKDVDTNISGLTLSKLVMDGPNVDVYARMAAFRHFEEEYQGKFWSYAPYVMVMGKGYTPWTEGVAFRFGFGLGFSYAQKVPVHEQVKQAQAGEKTSRFLNYLEWTVDVPLEKIIRSRLVRDCYVGITDVHRSGIFASADILGNVAGGSDWITFHVECLR